MTLPIVEKLITALGPERIKTDDQMLDERRHDYTFSSLMDDLQGKGLPKPACVATPKQTQEVVEIVNICRENNTAIVPFGLGSGVVGGVMTDSGCVLLDMGGMNKIREINTQNLIAVFEAGVRGTDAEEALAKRGLMLGHYPQSMDLSSVGGWVATRACGQFSTAYGGVEDILFSLEVVLPTGEVLTTKATPRAASGPDLNHLFLGSEGTLGIVTAVSLSVRWRPQKQAFSAYYATNMNKGFELQRNIIQHGWAPPVMRQYDKSEVQRIFPDHANGENGLLIMIHEGPEGCVDAEMKECSEIAEDLGCPPASAEAVGKWFEERNHVPGFEQFINQGIIVDTIEIAATWDKIGAIYDSVINSLNGIGKILNASGHSSHCYRSGINIYFTFAAGPYEPEQMTDAYKECWSRVIEATIAGGGGISHHHGIGRVRKQWMVNEIGESGVQLLRSIKSVVDKENIMNPGVLIP